MYVDHVIDRDGVEALFAGCVAVRERWDDKRRLPIAIEGHVWHHCFPIGVVRWRAGDWAHISALRVQPCQRCLLPAPFHTHQLATARHRLLNLRHASSWLAILSLSPFALSMTLTHPVPLVIVEGFLSSTGALIWGNFEQHSNYACQTNGERDRRTIFARYDTFPFHPYKTC